MRQCFCFHPAAPKCFLGLRGKFEERMFVKSVGLSGATLWAQLACFGDERRFRLFLSYWF